MCVCVLTGIWENRHAWSMRWFLQASVRDPDTLRTLPLIVNKFNLPSPPVSDVFWIIILLSPLPPPLSVAFNVASPLFLTRSPHPLPACIVVHLDLVTTHHPQASATCLCTPRRMPASAAVSRVRLPPLATLGLCPGPCRSLWGCPLLVPSSPFCTQLSPSLC